MQLKAKVKSGQVANIFRLLAMATSVWFCLVAFGGMYVLDNVVVFALAKIPILGHLLFDQAMLAIFAYLYALTAVIFSMIWMYNAHATLKRTGLYKCKKSSGSVVWSWFVPIMQLFWPALVMAETYRGVSGLASFAGQGKSEPKSPVIVVFWWLSRILGGIALQLVFFFLNEHNSLPVIFSIISAVFFSISMLLGIFMVRQVNRWQVIYIDAVNGGRIKPRVAQL